eukprot:Sspe_Gene.70973::Locus_41956_Transcript_1_1_Confidence_1.000_Length_3604::g.70973::m.70973
MVLSVRPLQLLLAVLYCVLGGDLGCGHDAIQKRAAPPAVVRQKYPRVSPLAPSPIRIKYVFNVSMSCGGGPCVCSRAGERVPNSSGGTQECTADDVMTAAKEASIRSLMDEAVLFLNKALLVEPVTGNLVVGLDGTSQPFCGERGGMGVRIPDQHVTEGVADADFVAYVSGYPTSPGVEAWAVTCREDQVSRPTAGQINFNAFSIATDLLTQKRHGVVLAIHELMHALGFTGGSLFNSNWFKAIRDRGGTVTRTEVLKDTEVTIITTPRVVEKAREYFACPDLPGVPFENQGGSGSAGSHWEASALGYEAMVAMMWGEVAVVSPITLAFFEDSGHYMVDYTAVSGVPSLHWGKGKGCAFLRTKCSLSGMEEFCFPDVKTAADLNELPNRCSHSLRGYGRCSISEYSSIPEVYRYFSNSSLGGGLVSMDYCPVVHAGAFCENDLCSTLLDEGSCTANKDCEYLSPTSGGNKVCRAKQQSITGHTFGPLSRCFPSTVVRDGLLPTRQVDARCFVVNCLGTINGHAMLSDVCIGKGVLSTSSGVTPYQCTELCAAQTTCRGAVYVGSTGGGTGRCELFDNWDTTDCTAPGSQVYVKSSGDAYSVKVGADTIVICPGEGGEPQYPPTFDAKWGGNITCHKAADVCSGRGEVLAQQVQENKMKCQNNTCDHTAGPCLDAGVCDEATGRCGQPTLKANGTACDDGDAKTINDSCSGGVCQGVFDCSLVTCPPTGVACIESVCNSTGGCEPRTAADATTCDDGDPSTQNDICTNGTCAGTKCASTVCQEATACQTASFCDKGTGTCSPRSPLNEGGTCDDGNNSTVADTCKQGTCSGVVGYNVLFSVALNLSYNSLSRAQLSALTRDAVDFVRTAVPNALAVSVVQVCRAQSNLTASSACMQLSARHPDVLERRWHAQQAVSDPTVVVMQASIAAESYRPSVAALQASAPPSAIIGGFSVLGSSVSGPGVTLTSTLPPPPTRTQTQTLIPTETATLARKHTPTSTRVHTATATAMPSTSPPTRTPTVEQATPQPTATLQATPSPTPSPPLPPPITTSGGIPDATLIVSAVLVGVISIWALYALAYKVQYREAEKHSTVYP